MLEYMYSKQLLRHALKTARMGTGLRNFGAMSVHDRSFINVSGPDSKKLLQGLMTNDINKLSSGSCQATAFLSSKGRIIADALVYQRDTAANETEIIIESDPFAVTSLIKLLSLYKLRSKVSVSLAKYQAYQVQDLEDGTKTLGPLIATAEPRIPLAQRLLFPEHVDTGLNAASGDSLAHLKWMYINGIPSSKSVFNKIPLECNMDYLNYIDFKKGCYLGQELTARTKYKGIVKKRILPFVLRTNKSEMNQNFDFLDSNLVEKFTGAGDSMELSLSDSVDNEEGDEKSSGTNNIVCSDGAIAGTMIGAPILIKSQGIGIGLGMFRLTNINEKGHASFSFRAKVSSYSDESQFACAPFRPKWMSDEISDAIFNKVRQ